MKQPVNQKQSKTHLTLGERIRISELLSAHNSLRTIANTLNKSPSTISREIKKHTVLGNTKVRDCKYKTDCTATNVCKSEYCDGRLCRKCKIPCKLYCEHYEKDYCPDLLVPPYVCNACTKVHKSCPYEKHIYIPEKANEEYSQMLSDRRSGFDLTGEELESINTIVSPLIAKGQSPYHILQTNSDKLQISESTLRRLIYNCELDVRNIDLREQVKRKPRRKAVKGLHNENLKNHKIGHLYEDFNEYIRINGSYHVQMDCVEGIREDNCVLLTLHFPIFHLQLAYIMEEHTMECVVGVFDMLEETLGKELFNTIFPIVLTDNGHEFMDIEGMERSIYGGQRTRIFYCEPNRSDEKGSCENNHRLIRYVIPKGTSLERFRQIHINLMMNHINSYNRSSLFGKCPYDLAMNVLPEDFFILLGLEKIPSDDVILKPSLFSNLSK